MTSIRNTQQANDVYFGKVKMVNGMLLRKHFPTCIYLHWIIQNAKSSENIGCVFTYFLYILVFMQYIFG